MYSIKWSAGNDHDKNIDNMRMGHNVAVFLETFSYHINLSRCSIFEKVLLHLNIFISTIL